MSKEISIAIFKGGRHTAGNGETHTYGDKELNDIVGSYNPDKFRAPLIISHETFGVPDAKLADHSADDTNLPIHKRLAYGFPKALKKVGDVIHAVFDKGKISPIATRLNREGRILSVSSSFYKPDSSNNYAPGKFALRHIAMLGSEPPAVKGMQPISLNEAIAGVDTSDDWFCYAEEPEAEEEDALEFSDALEPEEETKPEPETVEHGDASDRLTATLLQRVRDFLIDKYDLDTADKVLPPDILGILQTTAADDTDDDRWFALNDRVNQLEMNAVPVSTNVSESYQEKMTTETKENPAAPEESPKVDFSEEKAALKAREDAIAKREAEYAERESKLRVSEFVSFCEGLESEGKLIPAIASAKEIASFMESLHGLEGELNYAEDKKSPLEFFKTMLSRLPKQVEFSEVARSEEPVRVQRQNGKGDFDEYSLKMDAEIKKFAAKNNLSYEEASREYFAMEGVV